MSRLRCRAICAVRAVFGPGALDAAGDDGPVRPGDRAGRGVIAGRTASADELRIAVEGRLRA